MENSNEQNNPDIPQVQPQTQPEQPQIQAVPPQTPYQPPPQGQPPQAPYQAPQPPGAASIATKKIFNDLKTVCQSLLKDPVNAAASSSALNTNAMITLFAIQCVLMGFVSYATSFRMISFYGFRGAPSVGLLFYPIIITAMEIGIMFVCLLAMARIMKSVKNAREIFSAIAIASIPWSAVTAALSILLLILGVNSFTSMVVILLFMFALVSSICLLAEGLRDRTISNLKNLLVITVAYSVQAVLFILISNMVAGNILNQFMYSMPLSW